MPRSRGLVLAILVLAAVGFPPAGAATTQTREAPFDAGVDETSCSPGVGVCSVAVHADEGSGRIEGRIYVDGHLGVAPAIRYAFTRGMIVSKVPLPTGTPAVRATVRMRVDEISLTAARDLQPVGEATGISTPGFASLSLFTSADFRSCHCSGHADHLFDSREASSVAAGTIIERSVLATREWADEDAPLEIGVSLIGVVDPGAWPVAGFGPYSIRAVVTLLSVATTAVAAPGEHVIELRAPFTRGHVSTDCDQGAIPSTCVTEPTADPALGVATVVAGVKPLTGDAGVAEAAASSRSSLTGVVTLPNAVESVRFAASFTASDPVRQVQPDGQSRAGMSAYASARSVGCDCGGTTPTSVSTLGEGTFEITGTIFARDGSAIPAGPLEITVTLYAFAQVFGGLAPARASSTLTLNRLAVRF